MKILETQMSLPDRMVAESSVAELADQENQIQDAGFLATTAAAIEQTSTFKGHVVDPVVGFFSGQEESQDMPENFNPLSYVPKEMLNNGKLDHAWNEILSARNPIEVEGVVASANAESWRKNTIANGSGWGNFWGTAIGVLSSPEYWPGLLWNPSGGVVRTAAELGLIGTAETALHEYTLQQQQVNRDPYESLANVGTAALFSAIIGGGIGKFVKPTGKTVKNPTLGASREVGAEIDDIAHNGSYRNVEDLPDEIPVEIPGGSTAGAQEAGMGADAMPIRGMRWKSGYISLMRPLIKARVAEVHEVLNKYFGSDFQIRANAKEVEVWDAAAGKMVKTGQVEHAPKATSLARQVDRESNAMLVKSNKAIISAFKEYVGLQGKNFTVSRLMNRGKWDEFNDKLRYAVSNNDEALDPADVSVTKAAKELRATVYDPIEKLARELDVIDTAAKEQLRKNVKHISDRLGKSDDAAEIQSLTDDLQKAQQELEDFNERIGDVKFADTYANRRLHRDNIEANSGKFKKMLFERYREIRQDEALEAHKNALMDKIVTAKEFIVKRKLKLAKKLEREQGKLKTIEKNLYRSDSPKTTATRQAARTKQYELIRKLKESIKSDVSIASRETKIADLEAQIDAAKLDDFRITDANTEAMASIDADVNSSYRRVLDGELVGEVWQKGAHSPRVFKERQLPLTDNELLENGFLHTNMTDQVKSYLNSTLKPLRMKEVAGDTEMIGELNRVKEKYDVKIKEAEGNAELITSLEKEQTLNMEALQLARDRYYDRSIMYRGKAATMANIGRSIRNLNVMRMMGGVLTTSLGDVARLNAARIYSSTMGGKGPGIYDAFRTLKEGTTKAGLEASGFAAETVSMARLTKLVDMGVPLMTGNKMSKRILNMTAIGAKALMKATLLTQWTDFMKNMAAAMTQNQTVYMMRNYSKLGASEKTILAEMGIDETFAKQVVAQFEEHGEMLSKYSTSLNWDEWTDQVAAERMKDIMFRQSERILVTPRETDLPMVLGDTEMGRAFLQFKSFSLAAHNQTTVPLIERAQTGDLMSLYAMATMSIGAVPLEVIKMWESGREEELKDYTAGDWGLAIADRSAIAPMLSMGFNMIDMTAGNRITAELGASPPSRYSDRTTLGAFGPTFSTIGDMVRLTSGMASDGIDNRDARAVRRLMPFQNYVLLNRLANKTFPNQSRKKSENKYVEQ